MRIHVEGEYFISYDGMNHTLEQEGTVGKGGKGENIGAKKVTILGYYPSIRSCIKDLLKLEIKESSASNVRELAVDVARIESKIEVVMEHVKFQIKKIVVDPNIKVEVTQ